MPTTPAPNAALTDRDSSDAAASLNPSKQTARPAADILNRLIPLTKQGEDYIWRPATDAVTEIERLRGTNAELTALLREAVDDIAIVKLGGDNYARCNKLKKRIRAAIAKAQP